jgi:hypothetical protein
MLFGLPHVLAGAGRILQEYGITAGFVKVEGDFSQHVSSRS